MRLTPQERDRLLIFTAAQLAHARRRRGVRLNVPETIAVVSDAVIEAARDGARLADAVAAGRAVLGPDDVMPGVADIVAEVRVEAVFDDGTRLAVVPDPIGGGSLGDRAPGAVLTTPLAARPDGAASGPETGSAATDVVTVMVRNAADVAISVTSHWHFFEANPHLYFDRTAAYGRHLAIDAGAAVRFEPGVDVEVALTPIRGRRVAIGFAGLVDGPLDEPGGREQALARARSMGYLGSGQSEAGESA